MTLKWNKCSLLTKNQQDVRVFWIGIICSAVIFMIVTVIEEAEPATALLMLTP